MASGLAEVFGRLKAAALFLLEAVFLDALLVPIIFIGQEFAGHGDLHPVALGVGLAFEIEVEIDGGHDAVAEFFLDQGFPVRFIVFVEFFYVNLDVGQKLIWDNQISRLDSFHSGLISHPRATHSSAEHRRSRRSTTVGSSRSI